MYRQARQLIDDGRLGAVQSVVGFSGNSIGGHFLDTLLYLLGDPASFVSARGTLDQLYSAKGNTSNMQFVRDIAIKSALSNLTMAPPCTWQVRALTTISK